jgi:hypothetical protein
MAVMKDKTLVASTAYWRAGYWVDYLVLLEAVWKAATLVA